MLDYSEFVVFNATIVKPWFVFAMVMIGHMKPSIFYYLGYSAMGL